MTRISPDIHITQKSLDQSLQFKEQLENYFTLQTLSAYVES